MAERSSTATAILPVNAKNIGKLKIRPKSDDLLDDIEIDLDETSSDAQHLLRAAEELRTSNVPIAFPTETVYGLGADATRSNAVQGIYHAKQRPSDNPLIVHFASLDQLRALLRPGMSIGDGPSINATNDPIPSIYRPLIKQFWPGPLTIILPNPTGSPLAPEVTAGLSTFGARMPAHLLALALIKLTHVPVAAPSANASTKPSPTAAEHVHHDLDRRIRTIIDGGPCSVGVESTVVDGLSEPPTILRPGGISIEQLRSCPGWENVQMGYKNAAETGSQPRAPGMKYRHYSPKAPVILYEVGRSPPANQEMVPFLGTNQRLGMVRTKRWKVNHRHEDRAVTLEAGNVNGTELSNRNRDNRHMTGVTALIAALDATPEPRKAMQSMSLNAQETTFLVLDINIGPSTDSIARGIFAALRELDREDVDAILVEGIDDIEDSVAAAVMNRIRKASEIKLSS
ncbi:hypothetical protein LTR78_010503 [Recurvomyces mirabilis]|uniref:Threonylcarbamoyl-AMP synthase n=1 Tax=Recurvomyces mirabilis TaxID=574656 RepID=A0AAE0TM91_9PEZI|nr:hypothetical protein LTR78_010503 [Recurvomyces mirabilis]KAK5151686.1 hypothetical protein LTS14_009173 [Recurvomyces mirabilis]